MDPEQSCCQACNAAKGGCDGLQYLRNSSGAFCLLIANGSLVDNPAGIRSTSKRVRKTPSWARSWANLSLLCARCVPAGMHGLTCIFWVNLAPFSLQSSGLGLQPNRRCWNQSPPPNQQQGGGWSLLDKTFAPYCDPKRCGSTTLGGSVGRPP